MKRQALRTRVAALLNAVVALCVLALGINWGTFAAADTDPYGYVSQGDLIAQGSLRLEQPFARDMPWPDAESAFVPPGYALSADKGAAVPRYSTGLPLVMGAVQRASGRRGSVFYVVPALGAMAVWMIGWLGARVYSPLAGFMAAVLLATSPSFLHQIIQPVSDVPAAAWWTLSLTLAVLPSATAALGAGGAAAMAVLTRPNLALLAAVVGAFLAWTAIHSEGRSRRGALGRLGLFVVGVVPGCLAVAAINQYLYGSALRSGYGALGELYAWRSVVPNLARYPRWLVQTETPLICLAFAAPWVPRGATRPVEERGTSPDETWLLLAFALVVLWSYLPWGVFGPNEWQYLRFLLPAFPPLIVLSVIVVLELLRRISTRRGPFLALALSVVAAWAAWQVREAANQGVFRFQQLERRYLDVSRYIAVAMPRQTAFIAGLHAGSIRYHADRMTINFERLDPGALDAAVAGLAAKGFHPYIALEQGEEPRFRERFRARSRLAALDWPPMLHTSAGVPVHIFDPADRARFLAGEAIGTADMLFRGKPLLTGR